MLWFFCLKWVKNVIKESYYVVKVGEINQKERIAANFNMCLDDKGVKHATKGVLILDIFVYKITYVLKTDNLCFESKLLLLKGAGLIFEALKIALTV